MKAISLHQPWASLIAEGTKTIETRSWQPPKALIGQRIAIHAAKKLVDFGFVNHSGDEEFIKAVIALCGRQAFPYGKVVATAVLKDAWQVVSVSDVVHTDGYPQVYGTRTPDVPGRTAKADPYGDFTLGRWLWFLADIERLDPPVPAVGHQGFWNWQQQEG